MVQQGGPTSFLIIITLIIDGVHPDTMIFPTTYHTPEISVKDFGISLVYGVGVGASYEFSTRFKFYGSTLKIQSSWVGKENYIYETFTVIPHPLVPQLMKADQDSKDDFYGYCDDDYGDAIYDDFDER